MYCSREVLLIFHPNGFVSKMDPKIEGKLLFLALRVRFLDSEAMFTPPCHPVLAAPPVLPIQPMVLFSPLFSP